MSSTKFYVAETPISNTTVNSPDIIAAEFEALKQADQESVWVLIMSSSSKILKKEMISLGGITLSLLDPRILFNRILTTNGASTFAVVHNHPGSSPNMPDIIPSVADIDMTLLIKKGAEILNLRFLDHVIVGRGGYYSFANAGKL